MTKRQMARLSLVSEEAISAIEAGKFDGREPQNMPVDVAIASYRAIDDLWEKALVAHSGRAKT